jgi:hypothetical protein
MEDRGRLLNDASGHARKTGCESQPSFVSQRFDFYLAMKEATSAVLSVLGVLSRAGIDFGTGGHKLKDAILLRRAFGRQSRDGNQSFGGAEISAAPPSDLI